MRIDRLALGAATALVLGGALYATAQQGTDGQTAPSPQDKSVGKLLGRLDLERYKATIKGLAQFGDRRQGTARNRRALDWIEAQLRSYGCPTERVRYVYDPAPRGQRVG
jgi:hypothetical protein